MYLLDTDILIYALKGDATVVENLRRHAADPKAISVISYGELIYGAQNSQQVLANLAKAHRIRETLPIIDVTPAVMETFGLLKAELRRSGTLVDDFDLVIGATALVLGYTMVTNNKKHFSKIPGITVVNWAEPVDPDGNAPDGDI